LSGTVIAEPLRSMIDAAPSAGDRSVREPAAHQSVRPAGNARALRRPARIKKTLYWHEPWVYLTILGGVLIYALVALAIRKSAHVDWALCDVHHNRRRLGIGVAVGSVLLGVLMAIFGGNADSPELILAGLGVVVILPIIGLVIARNIAPSRIDDQRIWVKVGTPFLDSIPNAPPVQQHGWYPQQW
jgi:hypothetical protein